MATYLSLINFTDEGARHIKDSPKRARVFDAAAEAAGVTIVGQYWTIGNYDGVLIVSAESEEKALHWLVELSAAGNVRADSMQAFGIEEFEKILKTD